MRTVAIANQKGGCGKTTVAINLSASLAREGRRVLLIDLDPQAHCSLGMAVPDEQIDLSILECLLGQIEGEPVELSRITWQIAPNLDLAPSRSSLATLEPRLGTRQESETLLRNVLQQNAGRYDYCIVDCPPHLGLLMRNALCAADEIIIPVDTGYFSLHGLTQQLGLIEQLGERNGATPKARVLANQYDVRTKLAREILAELRNRFKGLVLDTIVNFNTKLKEGASFGQPITEFAPSSMGARDFQKLARELTTTEPAKTPTADILRHVEKLAADAERLLATTTTLIDNRAATGGDGRRKEAITPGSIGEIAAVATELAEQPRSASLRVPAGQVRTSEPAVAHEEIARKIDAIYGVHQDGDVAVFCAHYPEAREVQLAGDFNDWMPHATPMRRLTAGAFEARLRLPQGRYRYRYVVDGHWSHDTHSPSVEMNEYGELNSVVEIRQ